MPPLALTGQSLEFGFKFVDPTALGKAFGTEVKGDAYAVIWTTTLRALRTWFSGC